MSDAFKIWNLDKWNIFEVHKKPESRLKTGQNIDKNKFEQLNLQLIYVNPATADRIPLNRL